VVFPSEAETWQEWHRPGLTYPLSLLIDAPGPCQPLGAEKER
jgi:hypothetical protein